MKNAQTKHPAKSKTIWGLLATLLGAVAIALDWPSDSFAFLADGLQLVDVGAILSLLGLLWAQYGQRTATTMLTKWSGKKRPE